MVSVREITYWLVLVFLWLNKQQAEIYKQKEKIIKQQANKTSNRNKQLAWRTGTPYLSVIQGVGYHELVLLIYISFLLDIDIDIIESLLL